MNSFTIWHTGLEGTRLSRWRNRHTGNIACIDVDSDKFDSIKIQVNLFSMGAFELTLRGVID